MSTNNKVNITTEVVTKHFAEVVINGESKGKREINGGPSVLALATSLAKEYGIRGFEVTITDPTGASTPITSVDQGRSTPVRDGSRVAVTASDSRGGKVIPMKADADTKAEEPVKMEGNDQGDEHTEAPAQPSTEAPAEAATEEEAKPETLNT